MICIYIYVELITLKSLYVNFIDDIRSLFSTKLFKFQTQDCMDMEMDMDVDVYRDRVRDSVTVQEDPSCRDSLLFPEWD